MLIYSITNTINNKKYIGQTTNSLSRRKAAHLASLRANTHGNSHLQAAFNKYGETSFRFEVLAHAQTLDELNLLEENYIETYNTMKAEYGYNKRCGGDNRTLSNETKRKISLSHQNKKLSTEHKQRISDGLTGHTFSDDSIKRMTQAKQQRSALSSEDIDDIRELHTKGVSQGKLAKLYGCSQANIWHIVHNLSWKL